MTGVWIVLSVALSALLGLYLAAPLAEAVGVGASSDKGAGSRAPSLMDKKERALRALKDLELDYTMGKVSREDFERSKQELSREVARVLEELRHYE
jgi:hypothetical protein